ncbi:hypothetical protein HYPSUDRAFT_198572 [Hypholoma sublateritium FD-334 SS-4]|uniref:Uncharacterized protein n=1 Tax=Hypholoma sublateritium (strain FD-334 SS-4) TaxID=945553 RepID=A0A0D2P736_HYPSF|nr:hypothetical protein HYPSUDRAFT_198572 [Hypholoma sublateritium FD-334 SS-4]
MAGYPPAHFHLPTNHPTYETANGDRADYAKAILDTPVPRTARGRAGGRYVYRDAPPHPMLSTASTRSPLITPPLITPPLDRRALCREASGRGSARGDAAEECNAAPALRARIAASIYRTYPRCVWIRRWRAAHRRLVRAPLVPLHPSVCALSPVRSPVRPGAGTIGPWGGVHAAQCDGRAPARAAGLGRCSTFRRRLDSAGWAGRACMRRIAARPPLIGTSRATPPRTDRRALPCRGFGPARGDAPEGGSPGQLRSTTFSGFTQTQHGQLPSSAMRSVPGRRRIGRIGVWVMGVQRPALAPAPHARLIFGSHMAPLPPGGDLVRCVVHAPGGACSGGRGRVDAPERTLPRWAMRNAAGRHRALVLMPMARGGSVLMRRRMHEACVRPQVPGGGSASRRTGAGGGAPPSGVPVN